MVDEITIASLAVAAIGVAWAILATLVSKRKELRTSLRNFRQRTTERLNQTNQTLRKIVILMIGSAIFGAGLGYYVPRLSGYITVLSLLAWLVIGYAIFGNPEPEEEELMTRSEVEELVEKRLKEERKESSQ